MGYATPEQVREALAPVRDRRQGTAAMLEEPVIAEQVAIASQQVDGALASSGIDTPLTGEVPPLVAAVTVAVAAYLCDLIYLQGVAHDNELVPVIQRYRWAQGLMGAWAKGAQLPPGLTPNTGAGGDIEIGQGINPYPGRLFHPDDMTLQQGSGFGRTIAPLYDPDAVRWGNERGWS